MASLPPRSEPRKVILGSSGFGIATKVLSTFCMAVMFSIVKVVSEHLPVGEVVFIRSFASMAIIVAIVGIGTGSVASLGTRNVRGHLVRSSLGATSMFLSFFALSLMPLSTTMALTFSTPIFVTILAVVILGEARSVNRFAAIALGMTGVLVITGSQVFASIEGGVSVSGVVAALGSAITAAYAMIALRRIALSEKPDTVAFYFMLVSTLFGLVTFPFGWVMPSFEHVVLLVVAGVAGALGQVLLSLSYRYAEASTIAPLDYLNLLWSTLIGTLILGEKLGVHFYLGALLIVGGGLLITIGTHRARQRK